MTFEERLQQMLARVASGQTKPESAMEELRHLPFQDLDFAKIDQHRLLRQGMAEVIFCPGKTPTQVSEIAEALQASTDLVLASRADADFAQQVLNHYIENHADKLPTSYNEQARMLVWGKIPEADPSLGKVAIVTAGTADLSVAHEAQLVLQCNRIKNDLIADVGVAGLQRVIESLPRLQDADVCIVIAGMDGVLPSVVGGLLACPVIACPSSIGYGSAFEGLSALLTMLNSCAAGITVVNIDNGFGAAVAAFRILHSRCK